MARIIQEASIDVGDELATAGEIQIQSGDGCRFGVPSGSDLDGETVVAWEEINGTWFEAQGSSAAASQVVAAGKSYPLPVTANCSKKVKLVCAALSEAVPVEIIIKSMDTRS